MTSTRSPARSDRPRRGRIVAIGAIVVVAVLVLALAWTFGLTPRVGTPGQPDVTGTVTGTVATVNADGTALCLTVGGSPDNLCYDVWRLRGESMPAISDTVTGWVVRVPKGSGEIEELIIKPEGPFAPGAGVGL